MHTFILDKRTDHHNTMARRERVERVLESGVCHPHVDVMVGVLAEAWLLGEHSLVRDTIYAAKCRELKTAWLNGTRAKLDGERMKDAFDRYMAGRI